MKSPASPLSILGIMVGLGSVGGVGIALAAPTFEQILAAPDDVQLNLEYAQAEANEGHLLSAAAALERILSVRPNAHAVRLYYAGILYRLDDRQAAKQQLDMLSRASLSPEQAVQRDKYAGLVGSAQKPFKVGGYVAAGIQYQSDATGALTTQFDTLGVAPARRPGTQAVVAAGLRGTIKIDQTYDMYASISGTSQSTVGGGTADFQSVDGGLGFSGTGLYTDWKFGGVVRQYFLFGNPYLAEFGGNAELSWSPNTATTITAKFEGVRQEYHEPTVDALVGLGTLPGSHDGERYSAGLGVSYRFTAHTSVGASGGYEWKAAGYRAFEYNSPYAQLNLRHVFEGGISVDAMGSMRFIEYLAADPVFLGPAPGLKRYSTLSNASLMLGVPFTTIVSNTALENVSLQASVGYSGRTEKTPLADFEGFGASLRLVWRFGDRL